MSQLPKPRQPDSVDKVPEDLGKTSMFEVDCKVAAALCYVPAFFLNLMVAGVWLNTEPRSNRFVRFHAYQAILLSLAFCVVAAVLGIMAKICSILPFLGVFSWLGNLIWFLFGLAFMLVNFFVAFYCLKGEKLLLPYIGEFADQNSM